MKIKTLETVEISPEQEESGLKLVWKRNKQGGQKIGNRELIVKPTLAQFEAEILPRTRVGYYEGRTPEEQFNDFWKKDPNGAISCVDTGDGWKVRKVDDLDTLLGNAMRHASKGWVKEVDSFESPGVREFRQTADEESCLSERAKRK